MERSIRFGEGGSWWPWYSGFIRKEKLHKDFKDRWGGAMGADHTHGMEQLHEAPKESKSGDISALKGPREGTRGEAGRASPEPEQTPVLGSGHMRDCHSGREESSVLVSGRRTPGLMVTVKVRSNAAGGLTPAVREDGVPLIEVWGVSHTPIS